MVNQNDYEKDMLKYTGDYKREAVALVGEQGFGMSGHALVGHPCEIDFGGKPEGKTGHALLGCRGKPDTHCWGARLGYGENRDGMGKAGQGESRTCIAVSCKHNFTLLNKSPSLYNFNVFQYPLWLQFVSTLYDVSDF